MDQESVADALDVLEAVATWELAEERWIRVTDALAGFARAVRDSDVTALRAAIVDLELASPVRVTRIGARPTVPPPAPVLEARNTLVHILLGRSEDQVSERGGQGDVQRPAD